VSNTIKLGGGSGKNAINIGGIVYVGSAAGTSSATGARAARIVVVGEAQGFAQVLGVGSSDVATGSATGAAICTAAGVAYSISLGQAYCESFAVGRGLAAVPAIGSSNGTATVSGAFAAFSELPPIALWPGYESDGTSITIPIASMIGLTAEEADAVTGDWREILQAVLLRSVEYHRSFTWSEQPRTYNAFGMNLLNSRTFDRHFSIAFYTDMGEPNVAPEP